MEQLLNFIQGGFKLLFYLVGVAFIIYEIIWILSPMEQVKKSKEFSDKSKEEKGAKWSDMSEEYKSIFVSVAIPSFSFMLWMFVGILSFNWVAFLLKISFGFIIVLPISKLFKKYDLAYTVIHWLNSIIGLLFGLFVIINSYHLKIDLLKVLLSLF